MTELEKIFIFAFTSGFISGLFSTVLGYFLSVKIDKQIRSIKNSIAIGLFSGIWMGIVFALITSMELSGDINISLAEINRDNILMGFLFPLFPLLNRLILYLLSSKKNNLITH